MSETDVNREDQSSDEKKVTFNEEKEKEKEPRDGEEIDEEGTSRTKLQTKAKLSEQEETKDIEQLDCENTDDEGDDDKQTSSEQNEDKPRNSQISTQSHSKDSDIDLKKIEKNTTSVETDDDKEARRQSGSQQDSDEFQKQTGATGYSLNSRSSAKTSQQEPSEDKQDDATPRFMTDDEKMAQSEPTENNSNKNANNENDSKTAVNTVESKKETIEPDSAKQNTTDLNDSKTKDVKTEEKPNDEKKSKPQTPKVQVMDKPKPKYVQKSEQQKTPNERQKSATTVANRERPWAQQTKTPASSAKVKDSPKEPDRTLSPRQIVERDRLERRRKAQSARLPSDRPEPSPRDLSARGSSRASSRYYYRPPSRPRTCGYMSEERRQKEKEFFYAELNRLKDSLKKESKKIKKKKVKDHYPDVFTSLEPYYNTYTAEYLINMPDMGYKENQPENAKEPVVEEDKQDLKFQTRCTAIGLTDPWDSLNMDRSVLPKLETSEMRKKRMEQLTTEPKRKSGSQKQSRADSSPTPKKRPEGKQGSTRLPKFPMIQPPNAELTTKEFDYGDVPMLRGELAKTFGHNGDSKKKTDYTRTRQDFYRMELDRLNEYHKISRPHMRAAYFAYLQNTPGSKQAVYDCLKEVTEKKEEKPMTPQAVA